MLKVTSLKFAAIASFALAGLPAQAEHDSALIDALVRKGVLTDKEASEIRSDMEKHDKASSANKIKLSDSLTELKLYGDIRLRYQYDDKDAQLLKSQGGNGPANVSQQGRWRFRLRLNADFKLGEHWFGGVELSTAQPTDSGNQTYENGFDDYNIFISRAYLGWQNDWLTLVGGKMPNPFYTTDLIYDSDINPTGLAENIAFHKLFGGDPVDGGFSKDGKGYKAPVVTESPWEVTLIAGQFIFDDNPEFGGPDSDVGTDAYLFHSQLVTSYKFSGGPKLTVAPGWMTYINGSLGGLTNSNSFNDNANVSGATRNLNILLLPGDLSFKLGEIKAKFQWDFAYNIEGRKRTEDIYNLVTLNNDAGQSSDDDVTDPDDRSSKHSSVDDYAWLVGVQLGENKKAGDWSLLANWRQIGIGAIDPNLSDGDFALGELNTRGLKAGIAYNFTNFAVGTITYYYAWNLRDDLFGGEATGGNGIADSNKVQVLQVDVTVKF